MQGPGAPTILHNFTQADPMARRLSRHGIMFLRDFPPIVTFAGAFWAGGPGICSEIIQAWFLEL